MEARDGDKIVAKPGRLNLANLIALVKLHRGGPELLYQVLDLEGEVGPR